MLVPLAAFCKVPDSTLMVPLLTKVIPAIAEMPVPPVFINRPSLLKMPDQPASPVLASALKSNVAPA